MVQVKLIKFKIEWLSVGTCVLDTCGQGNNSWIELCYLICFFRNMLHFENHMSIWNDIWNSLYDNFSIKHLNHLTSAWLIGLSISLQFLMQGKVGGYASVFEKYQEKAESLGETL